MTPGKSARVTPPPQEHADVDQGKQLERGPDELTETGAAPRSLDHEFPDGASGWTDPVTRRQFVTLLGGSLAVAGGGCSPAPAPPAQVVPVVDPTEKTVPALPPFVPPVAFDAPHRGAVLYFLKE